MAPNRPPETSSREISREIRAPPPKTSRRASRELFGELAVEAYEARHLEDVLVVLLG